MDCYKQIRTRVNKLNLRLKRKYFSEKISECHEDLKGSWKIINQVINKSNKTTSIPSLNVEGVSVKDNKKIASSMNDFFCTIGNKLSDKIPEKPNLLLSNEYELGNAVRNVSSKAVSENDVTKVMKKMKTSHGSGCDGIASFFYKDRFASNLWFIVRSLVFVLWKISNILENSACCPYLQERSER